MERCAPSFPTLQRAMDWAAPLSSIKLPKMAPSKKSGKKER
jgi:hypothetical protein